MLTVAVCDDNRDSLNAAVGCIHNWADESGVPVTVYTYDNGDSLLSGARLIHHDLIFSGHSYAAAQWYGHCPGAAQD